MHALMPVGPDRRRCDLHMQQGRLVGLCTADLHKQYVLLWPSCLHRMKCSHHEMERARFARVRSGSNIGLVNRAPNSMYLPSVPRLVW